MIALTITTCKRYELFDATISSFSTHCKDIDLFDFIIHYDDSSSEDDRSRMRKKLKEIFPSKQIFNVNFEKNNFKSSRRHLEIMKIWKSQIMLFDYVFHLEDDWLFVNDFNIREAIDLMIDNKDVSLVGFSWMKKKFPNHLPQPRQIGNFWEWFYSEKYELNEPLFLDEVEMQHLPEGQWVKYINWPYFGFRPAIHDVKKINQIDNFNDEMESFELEFAIRFSKKFKSFLHNDRICYHIGQDSAYEINNSKR